MRRVLLISESTLKKYSVVSDNLDSKYITSVITSTQLIDLDAIIGTALREKLETLVGDDLIEEDIYSNYKELLDRYITDYLLYQVLSNLQIFVNYKTVNSGLVQNNDTNKTATDLKSMQLIADQYRNYANAYATKMSNYLKANATLFPEYAECVNYQRAEDTQHCGIFFESECKQYWGR